MSPKFCNGRSDLLLHVLPMTISVRPKLSSRAFWHKVSDTPRQFDGWGEKHGERDSHKAVPIAVTPHRLIAAEVPLELSFSKPNATITLSVATLSVVPDPLKADRPKRAGDSAALITLFASGA